MIKTQKRTPSIAVVLLVVAVIAVSACKPTHPNIGGFARDLAKEIYVRVCPAKYVPGERCGNRDVRVEDDSGRTVYINVYGVVDKDEIRSLVDFAAAFRGEEYKAIPIVMTFYAELREVNTLKALIGPKVIYKIKLRGGK
ncbi:MAG: hypothetical protein AB1422_14335 [bacterium]